AVYVSGRELQYTPAGPRRAGDLDRSADRVLEELGADLAGWADDKVDYTGRDPCILEAADHASRRERCSCGRLRHNRAAGRESRRELPGEEVDWIVPGHDCYYD